MFHSGTSMTYTSVKSNGSHGGSETVTIAVDPVRDAVSHAMRLPGIRMRSTSSTYGRCSIKFEIDLLAEQRRNKRSVCEGVGRLRLPAYSFQACVSNFQFWLISRQVDALLPPVICRDGQQPASPNK